MLLAGIGWAWEEVGIDQECALALTSNPELALKSQVVIRANPAYWSMPSKQRLQRVSRQNGLDHLVFHDEVKADMLLTRVQDQLIINRDILFDVFWLVTGQMELDFPKDKHGMMDLSGSEFHQENIMQEATASQIGLWLEQFLVGKGLPKPSPRWKDGKKGAFCLCHHVDYPEVIRWVQPFRFLIERGVKGVKPALGVLLGKNHQWHFQSWMELSKAYQMRATFFFVPRQGSLLQYLTGLPDSFYDIESERFRNLFREIRNENFEIGIHASYLAYQSLEKFQKEKERLENASGGPITLNAHHYWHLNPQDIEETLWMHEQIGLLADSSLTHDRFIGWRRGTSWPFFPFNQKLRKELKTLQVQNTWMDDQLYGNKKFNPGETSVILDRLVNRTAEQEGCMVVTMHEYIYDDLLYPGWVRTYKQLLEKIMARGDFWITSLGEITDHWRKRQHELLSHSLGLDL
jgi:peptidoglycan/xylan/chitin deacetylase (PgdA/CDA1 family)